MIINWPATWRWLNDPLNWQANSTGPGIAAQLVTHVEYSVVALAIASAIGAPLGLWIGHTGRGRWLVSFANSLRALPTVGLLVLLFLVLLPVYSGPTNFAAVLATEIVLVLLAVPPILANTYAGVDNVDPGVRDAARGMGMTGWQVLVRVEVPNAMPLVYSGLRSATLQVIATATVAAYLGLGGLGRFVFDGLSQSVVIDGVYQRNYPQMVGGAIIVALLALAADLLLAGLQRYTVSRGVTGRFRTRGPRPRVTVEEPDSRTASVEKLEAAAT